MSEFLNSVFGGGGDSSENESYDSGANFLESVFGEPSQREYVVPKPSQEEIDLSNWQKVKDSVESRESQNVPPVFDISKQRAKVLSDRRSNQASREELNRELSKEVAPEFDPATGLPLTESARRKSSIGETGYQTLKALSENLLAPANKVADQILTGGEGGPKSLQQQALKGLFTGIKNLADVPQGLATDVINKTIVRKQLEDERAAIETAMQLPNVSLDMLHNTEYDDVISRLNPDQWGMLDNILRQRAYGNAVEKDRVGNENLTNRLIEVNRQMTEIDKTLPLETIAQRWEEGTEFQGGRGQKAPSGFAEAFDAAVKSDTALRGAEFQQPELQAALGTGAEFGEAALDPSMIALGGLTEGLLKYARNPKMGVIPAIKGTLGIKPRPKFDYSEKDAFNFYQDVSKGFKGREVKDIPVEELPVRSEEFGFPDTYKHEFNKQDFYKLDRELNPEKFITRSDEFGFPDVYGKEDLLKIREDMAWEAKRRKAIEDYEREYGPLQEEKSLLEYEKEKTEKWDEKVKAAGEQRQKEYELGQAAKSKDIIPEVPKEEMPPAEVPAEKPPTELKYKQGEVSFAGELPSTKLVEFIQPEGSALPLREGEEFMAPPEPELKPPVAEKTPSGTTLYANMPIEWAKAKKSAAHLKGKFGEFVQNIPNLPSGVKSLVNGMIHDTAQKITKGGPVTGKSLLKAASEVGKKFLYGTESRMWNADTSLPGFVDLQTLADIVMTNDVTAKAIRDANGIPNVNSIEVEVPKFNGLIPVKDANGQQVTHKVTITALTQDAVKNIRHFENMFVGDVTRAQTLWHSAFEKVPGYQQDMLTKWMAEADARRRGKSGYSETYDYVRGKINSDTTLTAAEKSEMIGAYNKVVEHGQKDYTSMQEVLKEHGITVANLLEHDQAQMHRSILTGGDNVLVSSNGTYVDGFKKGESEVELGLRSIAATAKEKTSGLHDNRIRNMSYKDFQRELNSAMRSYGVDNIEDLFSAHRKVQVVENGAFEAQVKKLLNDPNGSYKQELDRLVSDRDFARKTLREMFVRAKRGLLKKSPEYKRLLRQFTKQRDELKSDFGKAKLELRKKATREADLNFDRSKFLSDYEGEYGSDQIDKWLDNSGKRYMLRKLKEKGSSVGYKSDEADIIDAFNRQEGVNATKFRDIFSKDSGVNQFDLNFKTKTRIAQKSVKISAATSMEDLAKERRMKMQFYKTAINGERDFIQKSEDISKMRTTNYLSASHAELRENLRGAIEQLNKKFRAEGGPAFVDSQLGKDFGTKFTKLIEHSTDYVVNPEGILGFKEMDWVLRAAKHAFTVGKVSMAPRNVLAQLTQIFQTFGELPFEVTTGFLKGTLTKDFVKNFGECQRLLKDGGMLASARSQSIRETSDTLGQTLTAQGKAQNIGEKIQAGENIFSVPYQVTDAIPRVSSLMILRDAKGSASKFLDFQKFIETQKKHFGNMTKVREELGSEYNRIFDNYVQIGKAVDKWNVGFNRAWQTPWAYNKWANYAFFTLQGWNRGMLALAIDEVNMLKHEVARGILRKAGVNIPKNLTEQYRVGSPYSAISSLATNSAIFGLRTATTVAVADLILNIAGMGAQGLGGLINNDALMKFGDSLRSFFPKIDLKISNWLEEDNAPLVRKLMGWPYRGFFNNFLGIDVSSMATKELSQMGIVLDIWDEILTLLEASSGEIGKTPYRATNRVKKMLLPHLITGWYGAKAERITDLQRKEYSGEINSKETEELANLREYLLNPLNSALVNAAGNLNQRYYPTSEEDGLIYHWLKSFLNVNPEYKRILWEASQINRKAETRATQEVARIEENLLKKVQTMPFKEAKEYVMNENRRLREAGTKISPNRVLNMRLVNLDPVKAANAQYGSNIDPAKLEARIMSEAETGTLQRNIDEYSKMGEDGKKALKIIRRSLRKLNLPKEEVFKDFEGNFDEESYNNFIEGTEGD